MLHMTSTQPHPTHVDIHINMGGVTRDDLSNPTEQNLHKMLAKVLIMSGIVRTSPIMDR